MRHGPVRGRHHAIAHHEDPIHLARAQGGPGGLLHLRDIEDEVVRILDPAEPVGGRGQGGVVDDLTGEAVGLDGRGDALDEGADRAGPGRDEAEDAGFAAARAPVAGALDHQPGQFDHQVRLGPGGLEEGVAGQGQDLAVAQGDDVGGVFGAGQHGHFAGGFAGPDDADELGRSILAMIAAEHAQSAAAQQIQGVGGVALGEQGLAPGQGEPAGARGLPALEDAVQGVFQPVGTGSRHWGVLGARFWGLGNRYRPWSQYPPLIPRT